MLITAYCCSHSGHVPSTAPTEPFPRFQPRGCQTRAARAPCAAPPLHSLHVVRKWTAQCACKHARAFLTLTTHNKAHVPHIGHILTEEPQHYGSLTVHQELGAQRCSSTHERAADFLGGHVTASMMESEYVGILWGRCIEQDCLAHQACQT